MNSNDKRPAIFLDRDGVINEIVYNEDTEQMDSPFSTDQVILIDGVKEAVRSLKQMGYLLFIITNQPAAAKGKTTVEAIEKVNRYIISLLDDNIDKIYSCYHFNKKTKLTVRDDLICECNCRKPKPGLLLMAMEEYNIDIGKSYMVGDSFTDVLAGRSAGVKTVFVGNFKCDVCNMLENTKPDIIVHSLKDFEEHLKNPSLLKKTMI